MKFGTKFQIGARIALAALALVVVSSLSHVAGATTFVNQPGTFPTSGCSPDCWTSTSTSTGGFITYDNFTLASSSTITGVQWQGLYIDFMNTANNPVSPDTNSWTIGFYANNSGAPGTLVATTTIAAGSVGSTLVGQDTADLTCNQSGGSCPVYNFSASVSDSLAAGSYWVGIVSNQTNFNPLFSWTSGTGGNGSSYQCGFGTIGGSVGCNSVAGDRDLTISGTVNTSATPEPSSLVLFGSGLLGLAGAIRRKLGR